MSAGMKIGRQQGTFSTRKFPEVSITHPSLFKDNGLVATVTLRIDSLPHSRSMGTVVEFFDLLKLSSESAIISIVPLEGLANS